MSCHFLVSDIPRFRWVDGHGEDVGWSIDNIHIRDDKEEPPKEDVVYNRREVDGDEQVQKETFVETNEKDEDERLVNENEYELNKLNQMQTSETPHLPETKSTFSFFLSQPFLAVMSSSRSDVVIHFIRSSVRSSIILSFET